MSKLRKIMAMVLITTLLTSITVFAGGTIVNNLTNVKITVYKGTPAEGAERIYAFIPEYADGRNGNSLGEFTVSSSDTNVYLYCDIIDGSNGAGNYDLTIVEYVMNGNERNEMTVAAFEGIDIRNIVRITGLLPDKNYCFKVMSKITPGNASFLFWSPGAKMTFANSSELDPLPGGHVLFKENPDLEAMNTLQKYGIIEGDPDGYMRPYDTITRAEMAKVLCKMLGLEPITNNGQTFSDVDSTHWGFGYIEGAWSGAVIEGKDDGTFGPEDNILFKDAVKMIVSAMGYAPQAEQMGGYPHGYVMIANQLDVTTGIDHALDVECQRNTVFKLLYNSLDVPFLLQIRFGENNEYQIADGEEGRQHITFRGKITGSPIKLYKFSDE